MAIPLREDQIRRNAQCLKLKSALLHRKEAERRKETRPKDRKRERERERGEEQQTCLDNSEGDRVYCGCDLAMPPELVGLVFQPLYAGKNYKFGGQSSQSILPFAHT
jgi:hypothetical protein